MARYTADSKEKVRDAVDFLALVGQYTELRKAGTTRYQGLCPFHDERTPSFGIDPGAKFFKCFGCGEGGDLFHFVELKEGLDFRAAMEFLADRFGVELELEDENPDEARKRQTRDRLLELLERTAAFYVRNLWESPEAARAREYLAARGLEEGLLREFRVGYSPSRFDAVLVPSRKVGYKESELLEAGLVVKSQKSNSVYDRFRGRIMFPLCDRRGRVLGFGARRLAEDDQGPKYLNSNDGVVFHKGQNLYASDISRSFAAKAGSVILAEGYTDVIALHQAGLRNAVGLMGTALTPDQVTELARLAPVVQLALDADSAGQEAMVRAAKVAAGRSVQLRVVPMRAGSDPADIVQADGAAAMQALVSASVPYVTFQVNRELEQGDLTTAEGRDAVIDALHPVFHDLKQGALREELVRTVASRLTIDVSILSKRLSDPPSAKPAPYRPSSSAHAEPVEETRPRRPAGLAAGPRARTERSLLTEVVAQPEAGRELLQSLDLDSAFMVDLHRRAARHLLSHPGDPAAGIDPEDQDLSSLMFNLVMRAGDHSSTPASLDAEHKKLRLAEIERRMEASRASGADDVVALAEDRAAAQREMDEAITKAMEESQ
jgi:DNA primase